MSGFYERCTCGKCDWCSKKKVNATQINKLTTSDFEALHKQSSLILSQIEQAELGSWKTKFELITQYVEIERALLEADKLEVTEKSDFATYIYKKLGDRGVTIARNQDFYVLFHEDEKNTHDLLKVEKISSTPQPEPTKKIKKNNIDDEYTYGLEYATVVLEQARDLCNDLIVKYKGVTIIKDGIEKDVNFRDEIKAGIGSINEFTSELKEVNAKLEDVAKHQDLRNIALEWKKYKAILLEKIALNGSKVARLIHVTPKHMSANIIKKEEQKLSDSAEWFDTIDLELQQDHKKGDIISIKIADWFNAQIERQKLNLDYQKPVISYIAN